MPNCALIPKKYTNFSAVRLAQLEGLGYGPDLHGENLEENQAGPDSQGLTVVPASKTSALKPHHKRREWIGQFNDVSRNILLSLLAEGSEPEAI